VNLPSSPNPRCTSHPRQSSSNLTTPPSRSQTPQSFVFSPNSINNLQHINPQKKHTHKENQKEKRKQQQQQQQQQQKKQKEISLL
jgi:hypothetical protein